MVLTLVLVFRPSVLVALLLVASVAFMVFVEGFLKYRERKTEVNGDEAGKELAGMASSSSQSKLKAGDNANAGEEAAVAAESPATVSEKAAPPVIEGSTSAVPPA